MDGVQSVTANADTQMVEITFDAPADEVAIKNLMAEINYPVAE